jgi:Fe-S cluster biogenesis protein NfuA
VKEYIETVLAPRIQADGGWVEFVSREGEKLSLIFRGECSKCAVLNRCTAWMEQKIRQDMGESVVIDAQRKKPFFWDNV